MSIFLTDFKYRQTFYQTDWITLNNNHKCLDEYRSDWRLSCFTQFWYKIMIWNRLLAGLWHWRVTSSAFSLQLFDFQRLEQIANTFWNICSRSSFSSWQKKLVSLWWAWIDPVRVMRQDLPLVVLNQVDTKTSKNEYDYVESNPFLVGIKAVEDGRLFFWVRCKDVNVILGNKIHQKMCWTSYCYS